MLASALAAAVMGAAIQRLQIFIGPSIVLRAQGPTVRVGIIPLVSYAEFEPRGEGRWSIDDLAAWRRAVVALSGGVVLALVAMLLLGPLEAAECIGRTYEQLVWLLVSSHRASAALHAFAEIDSPRLIAGTLAAKIAVYNLLPFETLSGGMLVRLGMPRGRSTAFDRVYAGFSSIALLAIGGAVLVAWLWG